MAALYAWQLILVNVLMMICSDGHYLCVRRNVVRKDTHNARHQGRTRRYSPSCAGVSTLKNVYASVIPTTILGSI